MRGAGSAAVGVGSSTTIDTRSATAVAMIRTASVCGAPSTIDWRPRPTTVPAPRRRSEEERKTWAPVVVLAMGRRGGANRLRLQTERQSRSARPGRWSSCAAGSSDHDQGVRAGRRRDSRHGGSLAAIRPRDRTGGTGGPYRAEAVARPGCLPRASQQTMATVSRCPRMLRLASLKPGPTTPPIPIIDGSFHRHRHSVFTS